METSVQSSDLPNPTSAPVSTEPLTATVSGSPTVLSRCHERPPPADVAPLGDSLSVGVSVGEANTTTPVKRESVDASATLRSVDSAGDPPPPPAVPVKLPPSLVPAVVETPASPSPSTPEPTKTAPACPAAKNDDDAKPRPEPGPEVKPVPRPEPGPDVKPVSGPEPVAEVKPIPQSAAVTSVSPTPTAAPQSTPKDDAQPSEKAAAADAPVTGSSTSEPTPAKLSAKPGSGASPQQQAPQSPMSSVTPTPSTSTMQSDVTTPRSLRLDKPVADDLSTSSSYGSVKTPGSQAAGSYLRCHQRRSGIKDRVGEANTSSAAGDVSADPVYHHERKSRSVSPTDSYRSSTTSTMRTSTDQDSRGRSPAQTPQSVSAQPTSSDDWPRTLSPYPLRAFSPRHVTEYRHCVAPEPDDVRPSRRRREDTHIKLFGGDKPDSPRTAAAAAAAATGGLKPKPTRYQAEDTQSTLFGPPDPHRKSSRPHPDTYKSLFGPPLPQSQRRSRSCYQDTVDLLHHDPSAAGRSDEALQAVRGRYALRHQDTGAKLFGDVHPEQNPSSPLPRSQRDHDIFLVGETSPSTSSTITSTVTHADPLSSP